MMILIGCVDSVVISSVEFMSGFCGLVSVVFNSSLSFCLAAVVVALAALAVVLLIERFISIV